MFLGGEVIEVAVESLMNRNSWEEFLKTAGREFNSRFSTAGWLRKNCKVSFSSQKYSAILRGAGDPVNPEIEFVFGDEFEKLYTAISGNPAKQPSVATMTPSERQALRQDLWVELSLLLNRKRTQTISTYHLGGPSSQIWPGSGPHNTPIWWADYLGFKMEGRFADDRSRCCFGN
jgi:hypothetical protein